MVVGLFAYQYLKQRKINVPSVGQINTPNTQQDVTAPTTQNPDIKPQVYADKDFCVNNMLGIRLPYDKDTWTCKNSGTESMNDIHEMMLTKQNIVITFSDGDRGESCLSCTTERIIVMNDFAKLTKYSNSTEGNLITYTGYLTNDDSVWISIARTYGMENVYGSDFTAAELAEIIAALSPTAGKN